MNLPVVASCEIQRIPDGLFAVWRNYLKHLEREFRDRFKNELNTDYSYVRFPFETSPEKLAVHLQDLAIDLRNDTNEQNRFKNESLAAFWIGVGKEYKKLQDYALPILVQFGSTYACEAGFNIVSLVKSSRRAKLNNTHLSDNLTIALTNKKPDFAKLASK